MVSEVQVSQVKGSRINKVTILGVEAPVRQGANTQESTAAASELSQRRQAGCIGV